MSRSRLYESNRQIDTEIAQEKAAALGRAGERLEQALAAAAAVGRQLEAATDDVVSVVLIDPDLPGAGVSGVDVVRTLKAAPHFRQVPVFFLLRDGQSAPADVPVDGALELDQLSGAALLEAIRTALRAHGFGDPGEGAAREAAVRAAETSVARAGDDEVRAAVERIVREDAREVVPPIAERLIRDEIQRLRREHGFENPPP